MIISVLKKNLGFNLFFEKFEYQIKHTLEYKWIIACQICFRKVKMLKVIKMYFKDSVRNSNFCCNSVTMNVYAMVAYAFAFG